MKTVAHAGKYHYIQYYSILTLAWFGWVFKRITVQNREVDMNTIYQLCRVYFSGNVIFEGFKFKNEVYSRATGSRLDFSVYCQESFVLFIVVFIYCKLYR